MSFCNFANYLAKRNPLTPMGVFAPGSAHARPSAQPPIDMCGNFPPHVSAVLPSKSPPNPSEVISEFQNSTTILEFCPTHYVILREEGGVTGIFFTGIFIFKWHTGACKILKSQTILNFCPTHYVIVWGDQHLFFIGILIFRWHT